MYAPITPDTDAILESIQSLDTEIIPRPGTNIARAIDLAVETFKKSDLSGQQAMVLFTDGTGGLYLTLEGKGVSDSRIDVILQKLQRSAVKIKTTETAVDRYRWPLTAGLISLAVAFLSGIVRRHRAPRQALHLLPAIGNETTAIASLSA